MSDAITCPVCGDTDFDQGGLVRHIDRYCDEAERLRAEWAANDRRFHEQWRQRRIDAANVIASFARAALTQER